MLTCFTFIEQYWDIFAAYLREEQKEFYNIILRHMHSQVTALPLYSNKAFQESYDLIYNHTDGPWSKPYELYTEDKDGDILKLSDTEWY